MAICQPNSDLHWHLLATKSPVSSRAFNLAKALDATNHNGSNTHLGGGCGGLGRRLAVAAWALALAVTVGGESRDQPTGERTVARCRPISAIAPSTRPRAMPRWRRASSRTFGVVGRVARAARARSGHADRVNAPKGHSGCDIIRRCSATGFSIE